MDGFVPMCQAESTLQPRLWQQGPKSSVGTGCPGPAIARPSLLFSDLSRHTAVVDMSAVGAVTAGQSQVCLSARESSL